MSLDNDIVHFFITIRAKNKGAHIVNMYNLL